MSVGKSQKIYMFRKRWQYESPRTYSLPSNKLNNNKENQNTTIT